MVADLKLVVAFLRVEVDRLSEPCGPVHERLPARRRRLTRFKGRELADGPPLFARQGEIGAAPWAVQHVEVGENWMLPRFVPGDRGKHVPFDQIINLVLLLAGGLPAEIRRRPELRRADETTQRIDAGGLSALPQYDAVAGMHVVAVPRDGPVLDLPGRHQR